MSDPDLLETLARHSVEFPLDRATRSLREISSARWDAELYVVVGMGHLRITTASSHASADRHATVHISWDAEKTLFSYFAPASTFPSKSSRAPDAGAAHCFDLLVQKLVQDMATG